MQEDALRRGLPSLQGDRTSGYQARKLLACVFPPPCLISHTQIALRRCSPLFYACPPRPRKSCRRILSPPPLFTICLARVHFVCAGKHARCKRARLTAIFHTHTRLPAHAHTHTHGAGEQGGHRRPGRDQDHRLRLQVSCGDSPLRLTRGGSGPLQRFVPCRDFPGSTRPLAAHA